ncbi:hypothetical protein CAI21_15175 [Alkalilimnicola ehrlichii]|uniref:diguanylate cyclase n=1 Tax=Alkalilimnicola ehrlichii TaxID=351052 RepID=A0A3E0WT82_9GAMM|nr:diguanylate cyclase [Alkalilimnicola ehrlichii]RFA27189.1 hypothetical protein CAI21_15175 [Alkalilimnicola ehrlichii]RFA35361.1 hypothetical protein CAL65_12830 [Alkalilimnicola ehrlichii]
MKFPCLARLWSAGTTGKPPRSARHIALINQLGLFGVCATLPYQVFYLLHGISLYWPSFVANVFFIAGYLVALPLNGWGWHNSARNVVVLNGCTQLFVVTYFISNGAGVHLFYFSVGGVLPLMFYRRQELPLLVVATVGVVVLFVFCHFYFPPGSTPIPIADSILGGMYAASAFGAIGLLAVVGFLFRERVEDAESDLTRTNRRLEQLSQTDQLTGLANRRTLEEWLRRELARAGREGKPVSVLMCDVDHFKAYNDWYGHQAGDRCLRNLAKAFQKVVRRPSDLVARYGGEEFVVILPLTGNKGAFDIAEALRRAVEQLAIPHERSTSGPVVTISIGVATLDPVPPAQLNIASRLLRAADMALYDAKSKNRNRVMSRMA